MINTDIIGFKEAFKVLENVPNVGNDVIRSASSKAGLVVKKEAKKIVISEATDEGDISWSRWIARAIVVKRNKRSRAPGAAVLVQGPDIPLSGRLFTTWKAARIWAHGAFNTPNRKGKGRFDGFGDFMKEAAENKDAEIRSVFLANVIPGMQKAGDRLMRKYGKHARK